MARTLRRRRCGHHLARRLGGGVAAALERYAELGVTHFILSDTPYQREAVRQGDQLLGLLRGPAQGAGT